MEIIFLLLFFFVVSMVQGAAQKKRRQAQAREAGLPVEAPHGEVKRQGGVRDMLEEFRRAMGEMEQRADVGVQGGEDVDVEDRRSLEVEPAVESLELPAPDRSRVLVDYDDQAEALIQRRIRYAEKMARGRSAADHTAFDERIRRPKPRLAVSTAEADRAAELRQFVVWREVLGKPLALRDDP